MAAHAYKPPPAKKRVEDVPDLEQLERQLIALLYAIWRAQGKSKRVVDITQKDGNDEDSRLQERG